MSQTYESRRDEILRQLDACVQAGLNKVCSQCQLPQPIEDYSGAQLKKKGKRVCTPCLTGQTTTSTTANPNDERILNLNVIPSGGRVSDGMHFKVKGTTYFSQVLSAYCTQKGLEPDSIRLMWNDQTIQPGQTPDELGLEDKEEIEATSIPTNGLLASSSSTTNNCHDDEEDESLTIFSPLNPSVDLGVCTPNTLSRQHPSFVSMPESDESMATESSEKKSAHMVDIAAVSSKKISVDELRVKCYEEMIKRERIENTPLEIEQVESPQSTESRNGSIPALIQSLLVMDLTVDLVQTKRRALRSLIHLATDSLANRDAILTGGIIKALIECQIDPRLMPHTISRFMVVLTRHQFPDSFQYTLAIPLISLISKLFTIPREDVVRLNLITLRSLLFNGHRSLSPTNFYTLLQACVEHSIILRFLLFLRLKHPFLSTDTQLHLILPCVVYFRYGSPAIRSMVFKHTMLQRLTMLTAGPKEESIAPSIALFDYDLLSLLDELAAGPIESSVTRYAKIVIVRVYSYLCKIEQPNEPYRTRFAVAMTPQSLHHIVYGLNLATWTWHDIQRIFMYAVGSNFFHPNPPEAIRYMQSMIPRMKSSGDMESKKIGDTFIHALRMMQEVIEHKRSKSKEETSSSSATSMPTAALTSAPTTESQQLSTSTSSSTTPGEMNQSTTILAHMLNKKSYKHVSDKWEAHTSKHIDDLHCLRCKKQLYVALKCSGCQAFYCSQSCVELHEEGDMPVCDRMSRLEDFIQFNDSLLNLWALHLRSRYSALHLILPKDLSGATTISTKFLSFEEMKSMLSQRTKPDRDTAARRMWSQGYAYSFVILVEGYGFLFTDEIDCVFEGNLHTLIEADFLDEYGSRLLVTHEDVLINRKFAHNLPDSVSEDYVQAGLISPNSKARALGLSIEDLSKLIMQRMEFADFSGWQGLMKLDGGQSRLKSDTEKKKSTSHSLLEAAMFGDASDSNHLPQSPPTQAECIQATVELFERGTYVDLSELVQGALPQIQHLSTTIFKEQLTPRQFLSFKRADMIALLKRSKAYTTKNLTDLQFFIQAMSATTKLSPL